MFARIAIALAIAIGFVAFPALPVSTVIEENEAMEWAMFWHESYEEHEDAFTALFNSYEIKTSKNGRVMIRQGNSGSFKFAKKG